MKDLRVANKNDIQPYDPRKTKHGRFGMYPVLLRKFKKEKSNGSAVFCLFYDLIAELLWSDLSKDDEKVPAWTLPLKWKTIALECDCTEQMARAIVMHGAEAHAIEIHPVGDSYQIALRPENWDEAKPFVSADYRDTAYKSEEKEKAKVSALPADRVVLMPGRSHPITLGDACSVRETLFDGLRDNHPVTLEFHSASGAQIEAGWEMSAGAIRVHLADVKGETKAKPKVSALTSQSRDLFDTLCLTLDACGRPTTVKMRAECLKAWDRFAPSEQERIVKDAGTRARLTSGKGAWNKPEWTPPLPEYLESEIWDRAPIAPRKLAMTAGHDPAFADWLDQLKEARGI